MLISEHKQTWHCFRPEFEISGDITPKSRPNPSWYTRAICSCNPSATKFTVESATRIALKHASVIGSLCFSRDLPRSTTLFQGRFPFYYCWKKCSDVDGVTRAWTNMSTKTHTCTFLVEIYWCVYLNLCPRYQIQYFWSRHITLTSEKAKMHKANHLDIKCRLLVDLQCKH